MIGISIVLVVYCVMLMMDNSKETYIVIPRDESCCQTDTLDKNSVSYLLDSLENIPPVGMKHSN